MIVELYVLNDEYEAVAIIDNYNSLIWVKRYCNCGDFELCIPAHDELLNYLKPDYFLIREDDDTVMVIEKMHIKTDVEDGDFFIVSGRSFESVLLRRIVLSQKIIQTTSFIAGMQDLVTFCTTTEHLGPHDTEYRNIPGLTVDTSFDLTTNLNTQFTGDTLLAAIIAICSPLQIGFKITLSGSTLTLSFYQGQEVDVTFSPEFDNLVNSDYYFDTTNYATAAFAYGEGEGSSRARAGYNSHGRWGGLKRRELYVDARDISSNNGEIPWLEYLDMLTERGKQKLFIEHDITQSFEAEIEPNITYRYKEDYNLGDIVTVTNEYGVTAKPRIVEIIESWDETGYKVVPTFEELEVES